MTITLNIIISILFLIMSGVTILMLIGSIKKKNTRNIIINLLILTVLIVVLLRRYAILPEILP